MKEATVLQSGLSVVKVTVVKGWADSGHTVVQHTVHTVLSCPAIDGDTRQGRVDGATRQGRGCAAVFGHLDDRRVRR